MQIPSIIGFTLKKDIADRILLKLVGQKLVGFNQQLVYLQLKA